MFQPNERQLDRRPSSIVSHELAYTIERRVLGIFATEWIPGGPLPVHEEPLRDPCTGSGSYFLVLKRIRREPRAASTSNETVLELGGDPSVGFFRVDVHACTGRPSERTGNDRSRNEEEEPRRERDSTW